MLSYLSWLYFHNKDVDSWGVRSHSNTLIITHIFGVRESGCSPPFGLIIIAYRNAGSQYSRLLCVTHPLPNCRFTSVTFHLILPTSRHLQIWTDCSLFPRLPGNVVRFRGSPQCIKIYKLSWWIQILRDKRSFSSRPLSFGSTLCSSQTTDLNPARPWAGTQSAPTPSA